MGTAAGAGGREPDDDLLAQAALRALATWCCRVEQRTFGSGHVSAAYNREGVSRRPDAGRVKAMRKVDAVRKSDAEWKRDLTPTQYHVLRASGGKDGPY